jgi:hypothetical protein
MSRLINILCNWQLNLTKNVTNVITCYVMSRLINILCNWQLDLTKKYAFFSVCTQFDQHLRSRTQLAQLLNVKTQKRSADLSSEGPKNGHLNSLVSF